MRAYIACSEADEAVATALQEYLKPYGLFAEVETGARGFRHLQTSDVVIALWSRNSVFGTHRMQLEKRMLDAWAEEKLILVKLDHHFLPVGLRDLPSIDGTFEQARSTMAWPTVARQAKERINDLLVRSQQPVEESASDVDLAAPPPQAGSADLERAPPIREKMYSRDFGADHSDMSSIDELSDVFDGDLEASVKRFETRMQGGPAKARGGGVWIWLLLLVALGLGVSAFFFMQTFASLPDGQAPTPAEPGLPFGLSPTLLAVIAGAALLGLILIVMIARAIGRPRKAARAQAEAASSELEGASLWSKRSPQDEAREGAAAAPAAFDIGELVADAPEQKLVFISYAHADDAEVTPVVTVVKSSGRGVWIDKGGIQAGTGWAGEIVRAIKSAGGVMVMCSSSAFESDHVKREIYLADRYRKPMLPVFLEDAQPPEDFEFFFAGVQWLQLFKLPEEERAGAVQRALAAVS